jgi:hypothetical protein
MTGDEGGTSGGGRFETFDANRWFVVARDEEGYGVWRLDDLEVQDPVARFDDDDDGYRAAVARWKELTTELRRERWLPRLKWVVIVSAIVWAISTAISMLLFVGIRPGFFDGRQPYDTLVTWSQVISTTAMPVALGGFAIYAVLWLEGRRS